MRYLLCGAALCVVGTSAAAQFYPRHPQPSARASSAISAPLANPAKAPVQVAAPPASNAMLRRGVEVPLRLLDELTTKDKRLRVGQRVRLETSEPIAVQGITVIPVGTPAQGEITNVRNKGMWGKSGRFYARVLYLELNGRRIRLDGTFDDKGHAGGALAGTVSAIAFLPAGFFMTGTSAHLSAGASVTGYIDEDVPLNLPAAPPSAVLTVAAPAAPVVVPVAAVQAQPVVPTPAAATPAVATTNH